MNEELVKQMIDVCFLAKRITELTPALPPGMVPRHNNVIDTIHELSQVQPQVYVSDVARRMGTTMPGVTKLVSQLDKMGYVQKLQDPNDRRFVELKLTELGLAHYEHFVRSYHAALCALMQDMDEAQCQATIGVVKVLYDRVHICQEQWQ